MNMRLKIAIVIVVLALIRLATYSKPTVYFFTNGEMAYIRIQDNKIIKDLKSGQAHKILSGNYRAITISDYDKEHDPNLK